MKCGREVVVLGIGMHPWGIFPEKDSAEFAVHAMTEALHDASITWKDIQFMAASTDIWRGATGSHLGNDIIFYMGETGIPVFNLSNACATGVYVLKLVRDEIASGAYDVGIAVGAGKSPGGFFSLGEPACTVPIDPALLRWRQGLPNPAFWAMYMRRRMELYGETEELLASIKVKSSRGGMANPYARYRRLFTVEEVLKSPYVCSPLRLLEICATSQGGAAVILCSADFAKKHSNKPIKIAAATVGSPLWGDSTLRLNTVSVNANESAPYFSEGYVASRRAFQEADVEPGEIDMVEIPDNSPWHELEYFEVDGFCKPGEAGEMVQRGDTDYDGKIPVNMSGGMASFGEVTGAQGLQQIIYAVQQLRGIAPRQLNKKVKTAFCQTYGGAGNNSVAILKC